MAFVYGCAEKPVQTRVVYVTTPIRLPAKPEIPKIQAKDMACLTDEAKNDLIKRDTIIKAYIADLEATIEARQ